MIRLDAEWTRLMHDYERDHLDPRNRQCHRVGIPLIAASIPIGATIVGLPLATTLFTVGCVFQGIGHLLEGKRPAFVGDRRHVLVGFLWWLKESTKIPIALAGESAP
jgi:uncharacterized membrane protein YGL010W